MKLEMYLKNEEITQKAFAADTGVCQQTVDLWVRGHRIPRPGTMQLIWDLTDGTVGPMDFYDVAA